MSEKKTKYGTISSRMFANSVDLVVGVIFLSWLIDAIFYLNYPEGFAYANIRREVAAQNPEIAADTYRFGMLLQMKYPHMLPVIFQQFLFQMFLTFTVMGAYFVFFTHKFGGTLGKMLVGLKVRDAITGGKISLTQNFIRYLAYIPSVGFLGLGLLSASFRKDKRCWHDFLADSEVVYDDNRWTKKLLARVKGYFNIK